MKLFLPTQSVELPEDCFALIPARGDSRQRAAALVASDHDPKSLEFLCIDVRLARAAQTTRKYIVIGDTRRIGTDPEYVLP